MQQFNTDILSNNCIGSSYYEMTFKWHNSIPAPQPGQFLAVRAEDSFTPLLRRPFAFSSFNKNQASIIYQKRGPATEILSRKNSGDKIDIIAPMGNSFLENTGKNKTYILVAGGIGLGPMLFLGNLLKKQSKKFIFIFGCRTGNLIPSCRQLNELNAIICTDDGTKGFHGTVLDYLTEIDINCSFELYCCGPEPMLRACHFFSESKGITCRVSMEQIMACSIGACMGCVIKVKSKNGFARVCKEGPVFDSRNIVWS